MQGVFDAAPSRRARIHGAPDLRPGFLFNIQVFPAFP